MDDIAQGVWILEVEGRKEFRKQMQRPGRFSHQQKGSPKIYLI